MSCWLQTDLVPTCRELGIGIVAYSPIGRGMLTGKYSKVEDLDPSDARRSIPRFAEAAFQQVCCQICTCAMTEIAVSTSMATVGGRSVAFSAALPVLHQPVDCWTVLYLQIATSCCDILKMSLSRQDTVSTTIYDFVNDAHIMLCCRI